MSLTDLNFNYSYDSFDDDTDIVASFLEPCLSTSISYSRLTGYFNSASLAASARGMAEFIKGSGTIRIIASPELNKQDLQILEELNFESRENWIQNVLIKSITSPEDLTSLIEKEHFRVMAWLLAEERLQIKIVFPKSFVDENFIFHQKIGIFEDAMGFRVSFSGSINETWAGWKSNVEEFKVFRSWNLDEIKYLEKDLATFERYWNAQKLEKLDIIDLPTAVKNKLIRLAPSERPKVPKSITRDFKLREPELRGYQKDAVTAWFTNGCRGILQMATGTGKTRTAKSCLRRVIERNNQTVTVVSVPYHHIGIQWVKELEEFRPISMLSRSGWREKIGSIVRESKLGLISNPVLIVTQNMASNPDFISALDGFDTGKNKLLLIADEMHGLGAPTFKRALIENYDFRLGLSATPNRYFDEEGTSFLSNYFSGVVFEFTLRQALETVPEGETKTVLTQYEYFPIFVSLTSQEIEDYEVLSQTIRKVQFLKDETHNSKLEAILAQRSRIMKKSEAKKNAFPELLKKLDDSSKILIYCADSEQMSWVTDYLSEQNFKYRRFSGQESSKSGTNSSLLSERETIIESFKAGEIRILVAMKCLDEGVDIPNATTSIILASSGNSREFIQRRGRVLRQFPGKDKATIYDFVLVPPTGSASNIDNEVFLKELGRVEEFLETATNRLSVMQDIYKLKGEAYFMSGDELVPGRLKMIEDEATRKLLQKLFSHEYTSSDKSRTPWSDVYLTAVEQVANESEDVL